MDSWKRFHEKSLPNKKDYSSLNMETLHMLIIVMEKQYMKNLK